MSHCTAAALIVAAATASCATDGGSPGSYGMAGRYAGNPAAGSAPPPPMDPARKIAEQDCSKPVAVDQGNLRCK